MAETPPRLARSSMVAGVVVAILAAACTASERPPPLAHPGSTTAAQSPIARDLTPSSPASSATTGPVPTQSGPTDSHPPATTARDRRLLVVWVRGELPASAVAAVRAVPGVAAVATVGEGTLWLTGPRPTLGAEAGPSAEIPIDAAAADPGQLHRVLGAPPWLSELAKGELVLSDTSAALRRVSPGDALRFAGSNTAVRIGGVVPDRAVGAHEVFLSAAQGAQFGIGGADYLLVRIAHDADPATTEAAVKHAVPATPGHDVRVRSQAETAYLRQSDGVMPPEWTKVYFGEFAATPTPGSVVIDPAWVRANIVTRRVPILGDITCNRALIAPLTRALQALVDEGLSRLVDPAHYGGCFAERLIRGSTSQLSQHAYGAAIDVNVSTNLLGATPTQDPRVVRVFLDEGFVWGGDFLLPDGMHFEYGCPAVKALPERTKVPGQLTGLALCPGG